jgi:hypothetical protein
MKNFNRTTQFNKDNEWGKWGEGIMIRLVEDVFKKKDSFVSYWYSIDDVTKKKSELKKWDLRFGCYKVDDRKNFYDKFEVEVKTDGYKRNTGNLVFEKSCGKKSSGVFATKAKYFIYFLPLYRNNNVYIIKSEKLIELLKNYDDCVVPGGDPGSDTFMYKIARSNFDNEFKSAGGKILTYTSYDIPERFNKPRFDSIIFTYDVDNLDFMDKYEDPFDFG